MADTNPIRLGVNIDHAATIRQARFTPYPDLVEIVKEVEAGGADGITLHLREDRRHIQDSDVKQLKKTITTNMNLEMAATDEMLGIALEIQPEDCCLVPEKREELTTEGGLDVIGNQPRLKKICSQLAENNTRVSIFIEPNIEQISAAAAIDAPVIELHTGTYANAHGDAAKAELEKLQLASEHANQLGLIVNAGHGLDYGNIKPILTLPQLYELNIGHSIVARSLLTGIQSAVREMAQLLQQ